MHKAWLLISMVLGFGWAGRAAAQQRPWVVWEKVSPCSQVRQEWFTVAQDNPSPNGPNFYQVAAGYQQTFDFGNAMTQATGLRTGNRFASVCCREYSVWRETATGKLAVVHDPGTAGFGWMLDTPTLCCEEAETRAGVGPGCSGPGGGGGGGKRGGWGPNEAETALNGKTLTFYARASAAECQSDCAKNPKCKAFTWIQAGTYNPRDAAMCYLIAEVTGKSTAHGHTSGIKGGVAAPGTPGPPQPPAGPGTLVLVATKKFPDPVPWPNWTASPGQISWSENGNTSQNTFTPPPAQLQPGQSFKVNIGSTVHGQSSRLAGGMSMAGDFEMQPDRVRFDIIAEPGETKSGGMEVTVTAPRNLRPGAEYVLKIWVNFYVGYEFRYRAQ